MFDCPYCHESNIDCVCKDKNEPKPLIYIPPLTTNEMVHLKFPWIGRIWNVYQIPYKRK